MVPSIIDVQDQGGVGQDHVRRHYAELALRNPYNFSFIILFSTSLARRNILVSTISATIATKELQFNR